MNNTNTNIPFDFRTFIFTSIITFFIFHLFFKKTQRKKIKKLNKIIKNLHKENNKYIKISKKEFKKFKKIYLQQIEDTKNIEDLLEEYNDLLNQTGILEEKYNILKKNYNELKKQSIFDTDGLEQKLVDISADFFEKEQKISKLESLNEVLKEEIQEKKIIILKLRKN